MSLDYLIIGAGPAGLSCAIEAHKKGRDYVVLDKGCVVNSIYKFAPDLVFFSTPDLLQIGDLGFISPGFRPTRMEVMKYYLAVVERYGLRINTYENVTSVAKDADGFVVTSDHHSGETKRYKTKNVIFATGYYDNPNRLGVEGEDSPKVFHYYGEAHPYHGKDVAIIGAKNSAVEAALLMSRAGARVTLIHRGADISGSVKYWVRPDIDKRLELGQIKAMFNTEVTRIHPNHLELKNNKTGEVSNLENDFLFALTGYHPDAVLLENCGVIVDKNTKTPSHDPDTMMTNIPGIYLAGSIAAGINNNKIFIENSREHGKIVIK